MTKKSKAQEQADKEGWRVMIVGIAVVLLLGGGIITFNALAPEPVALNKDNCPKNSELIGDYALIVVDETDPIVGEYQDEILSKMEEVSRNLPKYGKFSLHDITTGKTRLASSCAPASGCNLLVENCDRKERHYQKNFLGEILGKTEGWFGSTGKGSGESLLIQRLAEISSLSDFKNTENRSIHIFSDMLQHDRGYSHHRRRVGDGEFAWLIQQPFYQQNKPELEGVSVHVYYLKRNKYRSLQTSAHKKFWKELFEDAGAAQVSLREINLPGEESTNVRTVIKDNRPSNSQTTHKLKSKSSQPSESTEPDLQAPSPKLVLAPPPNLVLEQPVAPPTALSAEDVAREYRERFVRSLDTKALSDLLDLHLQNHIAPETAEMRDKIVRAVVRNDAVSPETRGKMGELFMSGTGGFAKNIKDAYLLMRCAGGYNEKIRNLVSQLDVNDVESLENDLSNMKGKKRCN